MDEENRYSREYLAYWTVFWANWTLHDYLCIDGPYKFSSRDHLAHWHSLMVEYGYVQP